MLSDLKRALARLFRLVIVPVALAAALNWNMWGYPFMQPHPGVLADRMLIQSIGYVVYTATDAERDAQFVLENAEPNEHMYRFHDPPMQYEDYARRRGVIHLTPLDAEMRESVDIAARVLGWRLHRPRPGVDTSEWIVPVSANGFVLLGDYHGQPAAVVALISGNGIDAARGVDNCDDCYTAYEARFLIDADGTFRLDAQHRYRFDMAGQEFMQFPSWLLVVYIVYAPILVIRAALRSESRRRLRKRKPATPPPLIGDDGEIVTLDDLTQPDEATPRASARL